MSGTASVANNFAAAVTATGAQLDANFGTVVAFLNDPTNRNNYAADAGATNTVVLTFAPPVVGGYTAGLELAWKWAATNTGGVVVNANGLGNVALVNVDGSALQAGQGVVGSIGKAVSDGTRAIYITPPSPATKAQMETATASATFLSPAQAINHPGVAKVTGVVSQTTGSYTLTSAFNAGSLSKLGTGTISVSFAVTMANTTYPALVNTNVGASDAQAFVNLKATNGMVVVIRTSTTNAAAENAFDFVVFGPLA